MIFDFSQFYVLFLFFSYAKRTSKAKVFSWKQANHFAKVTPEWEFKINHQYPRRKYVHTTKPTKKSNCGHFQPHLHFFAKGWKKKVKSVKKIYEMKMWWSHFLFLLQKKYLLTNFTLQFLLLLCLHKWIFVKFQKISVRKFSLIFLAIIFHP